MGRMDAGRLWVCLLAAVTACRGFNTYTASCTAVGGTCNWGDVQNTIYLADEGDLVYVANGTWTGCTSPGLNLKQNVGITIQAGPGVWVDCGTADSRAFDVYMEGGDAHPDTIMGFSIHGSVNSGYGGAIRAFQSTLTIVDCNFYSNRAQSGGSIHIYLSTARIHNCYFNGSTAYTDGGAIRAEQDSRQLDFTSSTVENCMAYGIGGAFVHAGGTVRINGTTLRGNQALLGGGVGTLYGTLLVLTDMTITRNTGLLSGGGIYVLNANINILRILVNFNSQVNQTGFGGGMYAQSTQVSVSLSSFVGNSACGAGGGTYLTSLTADFTDCLQENNTAALFGGGLVAGPASSATWTRGGIHANVANLYGGGVVSNNSNVFLHECEVSSNIVVAPGGFGGGAVIVSASYILDSVLMSCNNASDGSAIWMEHAGASMQSTGTIRNHGGWGNTNTIHFNFSNNLAPCPVCDMGDCDLVNGGCIAQAYPSSAVFCGSLTSVPVTSCVSTFCPAISATSGFANTCNVTLLGGTCNQTCLPGYIQSGGVRSCLLTGSWTGVTCTLIQCPFIPISAGYDTNCSLSLPGATCNQTCSPSYFKVPAAAARTCLPSGDWTVVTCNATQCPAITTSTGYINGCPISPFGTICNQTCAANYFKNPPFAARQCLPTGAWTVATCDPVQCPVISISTGYTTGCPATDVSGSCNQTCAANYFKDPPAAARVCQPSGVWSVVTCNATQCPAIATSTGYQDGCPMSAFGVTCNQTCASGYVKNPPAGARVCQPSGEWTSVTCDLTCPPQTFGAGPACQRSVVGSVCIPTCTFPLGSYQTNVTCQADGQWSEFTCLGQCSASSATGGRSALPAGLTGDVVTASCLPNYIAYGNTTYVCGGSSLSWEGNLSCTPIMCPAIVPSPAGSWMGCAASPFDTTCPTVCATGYRTSQTITSLTCMTTGQWSDNFACALVTCPSLLSNETFSSGCSSGNFNTTCTQTCAQGFIPDGSLTRTCQADGTWSYIDCTLNTTTGGTTFCDPLPIPENGAQDGACTRSVGSSCAVACSAGYAAKPGSVLSRMCVGAGSWDNSDVACLPCGPDCATCSAPFPAIQCTSCKSALASGASCSAATTYGIIAAGAAVALIVIFVIVLFVRKKKKDGDRTGDTTSVVSADQVMSKRIKGLLKNATPLGRGGAAEVFKASLESGEMIAIKKLSARDQRAQTEFHREVIILSRLAGASHPNVIELKFFTSTPPCIALELAEKGSLKLLLQQGAPPNGVSIMQQVSNGMQFLHEHAIAHLDLKPDNILIGEKDIMKITDFGASTEIDLTGRAIEFTLGTLKGFDSMSSMDSGRSSRAASFGGFTGTPSYSAPERFMSSALCDLRAADVFSFGVMAWAVATGDRPLVGETAESLIVSYTSDRLFPATALPIPDNCPPVLKEVISKCILRDAGGRPLFRNLTPFLNNQGPLFEDPTSPLMTIPPPPPPATGSMLATNYTSFNGMSMGSALDTQHNPVFAASMGSDLGSQQ